MGCVYSKPRRRARDDEVSRVSRRERRLWQALSYPCCFKRNATGGYEPLAKTLELEEPEHKQHGSSDQSLTHREKLQQKLAEKEGGVRQPLEQQESKRSELQTKDSQITVPHGQITVPHGQITVPHGQITVPHGQITVLRGQITVPHGQITVSHGQITVPHGQITDLEDMKNKLIAAKEQELQLLKYITTQQEDRKQKMTEKEAELQHLQQSLEQQVSGRNELQIKITDLEGQIAVLRGQITDLEDAKDKLIAAKDQELQDERAQFLKCITTQQEDHKQKKTEKEAEFQHLQQSLEQQVSGRNELQIKITDLEGQIAVRRGQITDQDAKDKLIAAKEQELQDERAQFLKCITTQQEDHKQKMTEKEAEFQHLQQSLEQQVSGRNELLIKITDLEGQIAVRRGQITDQDAKDKLIAAKEQELQDERAQFLKYITTQQEDHHKLKMTEKEAEFSMQSLEQHKGQLLLPVQQGTDLSLKELDTELKTVYEWLRFGINLEVPEWKLLEIQENKRGVVDACRLQLFIEWGKLEERTWRKVVRALLAVGRMRLARELAEKYGVPLPHSVDDTSSLQHVASTSSEGQLQESSRAQECKEEVQELFEGLVNEREQQIKSLKVELEAKREQIVQLCRELGERKAELFQKTMQLEEAAKQVQKLEGEKEQLRSQWVSKSMTLERELRQQVAKTTSQAAYIQQVKTWLSNAMEMVVSKDKEAADYRQQISQKEEEITNLSERRWHHEAELHRIQMESCDTTVDQSGSKEMLEAFHKEVSQMVETSELKMGLTRAEKEKRQLELKEETTLQNVVCHKEEISWLSLDRMKCIAVGSGLELTEAQQLTKFRVHLADIDGDPCVINQDTVTAELKSIVNGSQVKAEVVSKTPTICEVSYQPTIRGRHDLSIRVNGTPIQGSPFRVYVRQSPHLMSEPVREIDAEHMIEDITTTRNGDVVVCGDNEVCFYARGGQRIKTIKLDFGSNIFGIRSRITVDSSDNIYLISNRYADHKLFKFNSYGNLERSVSMEQEAGHPSGIALSKGNKIFVCHRGNDIIQTFDTDLNFTGPAFFRTRHVIKDPSDLAFDSDGNLYVADCGDGCVHVFSQGGTYFGTPWLHNEMTREMSVHVDHDWVYVFSTDTNNAGVSVLTTGGVFIGSVGAKSDFIDVFTCIAIDEDGFVYTARSNYRQSTRKRLDIF